MQLFSAVHILTPLLVDILWTCLCRSGCIALSFEVLPMLIPGRNLMEILMLRKEVDVGHSREGLEAQNPRAVEEEICHSRRLAG